MSTFVKTVWADVFGLMFRQNISTFSDLFEKNVEIFLCPVGMTVTLEIHEMSILT